MEKSFTDIAIIEIAKLLMPLKQLDDPKKIIALIHELGWRLNDDVMPDDVDLSFLDPLLEETNNLAMSLLGILQQGETPELLNEVSQYVFNIIETVNGEDFANGFNDEINKLIDGTINAAEVLPRRILDYLLYRYLQTYHQKIFAPLYILGILEEVPGKFDDSPPDWNGIRIKTVQWQRLPQLSTDPLALADEVYEWNNDEGIEFKGNKFLYRFQSLLRAFLLPGGIYTPVGDIRTGLGLEEINDKEIRMPIYQTGVWSADDDSSNYVELDLNLCPIPVDGDKKSGLAMYPYFFGTLGKEKIALSDNWSLELTGNFDTNKSFGIKIRAPHDLELITDLFEDPQNSIDARIEATCKRSSAGESLTYIFGSEDESHLAFKDIALKGYAAQQSGDQEIGAELDIKELTLSIKPGSDADGFLQKILNGIDIKAVTDLVFGISNKDGFYFRGSSALTITIPVNQELGPLYIDSVLIGVGIDDNIEVILAASLSAELGPVAASVTRIGMRIPITYPADGKGNLGPVQVEAPKFLPPIGAGMVLDAAIISGGGYIEFDDENKRYAGILELKLGEIGLVAIALITTRMPDGSDGFSMVVNIGVTFCPAIQLSYGFTLNGVGGLIGINRMANVDFLREGIRAGTLNSILFPENPVQNANRIISDMRNAFPATEGRFVVGPMVKIGWGTPAIITADICIILDLPMPVRILLLGQIAVALPDAEVAIISLHLDVLGVVDFATESLSIDATLYDSKLLTYSLSGDAALRLNWGNKPDFALSMGGFHPSFTPPPAFPSLRPLTLDLSVSSDLQLVCKMYQALTPNTLQFGSSVQISADVAGAKLDGHLGYDTLIYFSPFSFVATMHAGVSVKYEGHQLASVQLELVLSGPTPWNARGTASFSVLFWDVAVDFNETWGPDINNPIEPVNPWISLEEALERNESWGGVFGHVQPVENFLGKEIAEESSSDDASNVEEEPVLVHPAGSLEVRENVLPLNTTLELLGNAPVQTFNRFELISISIGENPPMEDWSYVEEHFARGQFEKLSDNQKLSIPSFEKMPGGIKIGGSEELLISDTIETQDLTYEVILIDEDKVSQKEELKPTVPWNNSRFYLKECAQAKKHISGNKRFMERSTSEKIEVTEETFVIVDKDTLQPIEQLNVAGSNRTSMDQKLSKLREDDPGMASQYMVLPTCELEAA